MLGLEIPPFYRNVEHDEFYYLYFRTLKKSLSSIFRKTIFEFIRVQTSSDIKSYHALGSRTLEEEVLEVDSQLAEIEDTYRFLLLISPTNTMSAREEFDINGLKTNTNFKSIVVNLAIFASKSVNISSIVERERKCVFANATAKGYIIIYRVFILRNGCG